MADSDDLSVLYTAAFLTPGERLSLLAEMRAGERFPASAARNGEYAVLPHARNANRVRVPEDWVKRVHDRLLDWMPRLRDRFGLSIDTCQEPQFLAYSPGHFHRPHRDRGTDARDPESVRRRKVSAVVFLNPGEYEGGSLALHELGVPGSRLEIRGKPGGLVAFHSLLLHEVTPVTVGERYSIACWYVGAPGDEGPASPQNPG